MTRHISMVVFATSLLGMSTAVHAQDCSIWNNTHLAGTYTMAGGGSIDLSKALPGVPGMPAGLVPLHWVGATVFDGAGGATGWVALNAGGNQMSGTFVNKKYSLKPDCSIQVTYSLKINELQGLVVGPFSHLMVLVVKGDNPWWYAAELELHMMTAGTAPGTPPAPLLDSGVMYRISTHH